MQVLRFILIFSWALASYHANAQTRLNVSLLDRWYSDTLLSNSSEVRYNDCWGYTQQGIEYAMVGSTEGVHFFSIFNDQLRPVDFVIGNYSNASVNHRDIKTYQHYAYLVCDEGPSMLQIVDLSYLPDSVHVVNEISTNFGRVHNIFIDEAEGILYACKVTTIENGVPTTISSMRVFSLSDPENPTLLYTGPQDIYEVHDCYVRNQIAYLNCGYDGLRIYDFSNPQSPVLKQNMPFYQDQGYNHQGWITPDGQTYVFGDETNGKRLKVCSIQSNQTIAIEGYFETNASNNSVPHNIWMTNDFAFVAYYNEGLRIYDRNNYFKEIAHYDTYPTDFWYKLNGAWGIYAGLPSEQLLVSDRQNGLFLLDFNRDVFKASVSTIALFPNPVEVGSTVTVRIESLDIEGLEIQVIDLSGKRIYAATYPQQTFGQFKAPKTQGVYTVVTTYTNYLGDKITETSRLLVY